MRILAATILVVAMSAAGASAANGPYETAWQADPATPGDWFNPANWTFGLPTTTGHPGRAVIDNAGTALISSGYAAAHDLDIGRFGTGAVIQSGGAAEATSLFLLGYEGGSKGSYTLLGGSFKAMWATVGNAWGSGQFTQIGGMAEFTQSLQVSYLARSSNPDLNASLGLYELIGGQVLSKDTLVGTSGRGHFIQSGGMHTVQQTLTIGGSYPFVLSTPPPEGIDLVPIEFLSNSVYYYPPSLSEGRYELSGGLLATQREVIDRYGLLRQTGGSNTVGYLSVLSGGQYQYLAGSLNITKGLDLRGTLDFGDNGVTLSGTGILDFSGGTLAGSQNASLAVGPDSLIILAPGFDPQAQFRQFTCSGMVHYAGSDLVVQTGQGFTGQGRINDFVESSGHIAASPAGGIDLYGGIFVRAGTTDIGAGSVHIHDQRSGISAGQLSAGAMTLNPGYLAKLGPDGTWEYALPAQFRQTGGTVSVSGTISIQHGVYALEKGTLTAATVDVGGTAGSSVQAQFTQTGGDCNIDRLTVGRYWDNDLRLVTNIGSLIPIATRVPSLDGLFPPFIIIGPPAKPLSPPATYEMKGGHLLAGDLHVLGERDGAQFIQTGGEVTVQRSVLIDGRDPNYTLLGGSLSTQNLIVGDDARGRVRVHACDMYDKYFSYDDSQRATLSLLAPQSRIGVSGRVAFGRGSVLVAVPGSAIHITGSSHNASPYEATFDIWSTDPASLVGLENLTVIFEGGADAIATFEVAGQDRGQGYGGFFDNFALGTLQIGGDQAAYLKLVDLGDNQPDWLGAEALYVKNLIIGSGSTLDLGGLNIYYLHSTIADDVTFTNGTLTVIPEPATLGLLLAGAAVLRLRRRRR